MTHTQLLCCIHQLRVTQMYIKIAYKCNTCSFNYLMWSSSMLMQRHCQHEARVNCISKCRALHGNSAISICKRHDRSLFENCNLSTGCAAIRQNRLHECHSILHDTWRSSKASWYTDVKADAAALCVMNVTRLLGLLQLAAGHVFLPLGFWILHLMHTHNLRTCMHVLGEQTQLCMQHGEFTQCVF